jgi:hypothetical protein
MFRSLLMCSLVVCLGVSQVSAGADTQPLKTEDTIAPPLKYGAWIDLQNSSGERRYEVSVEITNDASTQVYGEVQFTDKEGKDKTVTFSDGTPAKFTTGNYIARIRVRVKTGGPTGAGVRITQK